MLQPAQLRRVSKGGATMRASELAVQQSEAELKKRRRLQNGDLLQRYMTRREQVRKRLDRAIVKATRAAYHLANVRSEQLRLQRMIEDCSAAIGRGELWPKPKAKKKAGRRIEL